MALCPVSGGRTSCRCTSDLPLVVMAFVGVFGDLDLDKAEDLLRARFEADLPKGAREFTTQLSFPFPEPNGKVVELEHEKEQAVLLIGYRVGDLTNPDDPALDLIDEACSDMASRLFIRIREELGLAYSVGSTRMQGLEPGLVIFYASTSPENLDRVQEEMLDEIISLRREGLTKEEFDRAKASWLGREVIRLQGVRELAGSATIDELVSLGWDNYRKAPDEIRALTQEQIRQAAEKWLAKEASVIIRLTNPEG